MPPLWHAKQLSIDGSCAVVASSPGWRGTRRTWCRARGVSRARRSAAGAAADTRPSRRRAHPPRAASGGEGRASWFGVEREIEDADHAELEVVNGVVVGLGDRVETDAVGELERRAGDRRGRHVALRD